MHAILFRYSGSTVCFQVYGRWARQLYPWDFEDPDHLSLEKSLENGKNRGLDSFNFNNMAIADSASPSTSAFSIRTMSEIFEEEGPIEVEYVKNVQRARYIRTWIVASVVAAVVIAAFLEVPNLPC